MQKVPGLSLWWVHQLPLLLVYIPLSSSCISSPQQTSRIFSPVALSSFCLPIGWLLQSQTASHRLVCCNSLFFPDALGLRLHHPVPPSPARTHHPLLWPPVRHTTIQVLTPVVSGFGILKKTFSLHQSIIQLAPPTAEVL